MGARSSAFRVSIQEDLILCIYIYIYIYVLHIYIHMYSMFSQLDPCFSKVFFSRDDGSL